MRDKIYQSDLWQIHLHTPDSTIPTEMEALKITGTKNARRCWVFIHSPFAEALISITRNPDQHLPIKQCSPHFPQGFSQDLSHIQNGSEPCSLSGHCTSWYHTGCFDLIMKPHLHLTAHFNLLSDLKLTSHGDQGSQASIWTAGHRFIQKYVF